MARRIKVPKNTGACCHNCGKLMKQHSNLAFQTAAFATGEGGECNFLNLVKYNRMQPECCNV